MKRLFEKTLGGGARARCWLVGLVLLAPAVRAMEFPLPPAGEGVVGSVVQLKAAPDEDLLDIARRHNIGYEEMLAANPGVDPWLPKGATVNVPTMFILPPVPREGLVINVAELRLYYYPKGGKTVITHPVGIGREGWSTPLGETHIVSKKEGPTWTPPASIRAEHAAMGDILPAVVPAGPDNPLGTHALYLGFKSYLMHGTNKPYGVGMRASHGCIRLYPEDIVSMYETLPVNTPVRVIHQPYKAGWLDGKLYLEAHEPLEEQRDPDRIPFTPVAKVAIAALGEREIELNWDAMRRVLREHSGVPAVVSREEFDFEAAPAPAGTPEAPATRSPVGGRWMPFGSQ
jgi:L,D-transpeptidase ErfK/SrfK